MRTFATTAPASKTMTSASALSSPSVEMEGARDFPFTANDFTRIRELIYRQAGISLSDQKRDMVYNRLARRLRTLGIQSFAAYLDGLERNRDPQEWEAFTNALTTNLTAFFRESHHFPILAECAAKASQPLSVWCAAASTGEEPYSIAMTLAEAGGRQSQAKVIASDIDTQALATASAGIYTTDNVKGIATPRLQRFFLRGTGARAGRVRVNDALRAMVTFEQVNLIAPPWPAIGRAAPFDVIFCRNVMIYFDKPTQARILEMFAPLLKPGGLLFAGHSENFSYMTDAFRLRGQTVYERLPLRDERDGRDSRPAATLPQTRIAPVRLGQVAAESAHEALATLETAASMSSASAATRVGAGADAVSSLLKGARR